MGQMASESARVSSGFPGCSRDEGTAMNSAFNSISAVILVVHVILNIINNNNNNNNNNVIEYKNNFLSMNMNTETTSAMGGLGRSLKRRQKLIIRDFIHVFGSYFKEFNVGHLYMKSLAKTMYKCFL